MKCVVPSSQGLSAPRLPARSLSLSPSPLLPRPPLALLLPSSLPGPSPRAPVLCRSSGPLSLSDDDVDRILEEERQRTLREYEDLKALIRRRTLRFGGALALYLFLVASAEAALCSLAGLAASLLYLQLLYRDVESYTADSPTPMLDADRARRSNPMQRNLTKVLLAYPQALRPRLLVLVALLGAATLYNSVAPEGFTRLTLVEEGALLGECSPDPHSPRTRHHPSLSISPSPSDPLTSPLKPLSSPPFPLQVVSCRTRWP
jgi:hypothetical protein